MPEGSGYVTSSDVVRQSCITDVWTALGGSKLRHGRGQAWWRDGDGWNVSLDNRKGTWFDHSRGEGGGVIDLIVAVRSGSRAEALAWLADYLGIPLDTATKDMRRQWAREREEKREAKLWARAAAALAELCLERENLDDRIALFHVMALAQEANPQLIEEYRAWRAASPDLTRAMVESGRAQGGRFERMLASLIAKWGSSSHAA